ncbi:hypothetical protein NPS74_21180, partial [Cutibacterium acnes subsp. acnes]|nr:hypothetical protein [Cutibacterium acnes subsp. acnes]
MRSLNLKDTAQFRAPYSSWLSGSGNTRGPRIGDMIRSDTAVLMNVERYHRAFTKVWLART